MPFRFPPVALVLAAAIASAPTALAHRGMTPPSGEIALSDWPLCDVFVVRGAHGYSVMRWQGGLWVFVRGDEVYGRVDVLGPQPLVSVGGVTSGRMMVSVDDVVPDAAAAESLFRERCGPEGGDLSSLSRGAGA